MQELKDLDVNATTTNTEIYNSIEYATKVKENESGLS